MPLIEIIEGVKIYIYAKDHAPPHFHANFSEFKAVISIEDIKITRGGLPKTKEHAILDWAKDNQTELMEQ